MYKNKTFIAIIPARGGSKRLPKKNILLLNNKPLVAYSIEAGIQSCYVDKVVVSSDNEEILKIADDFDAQSLKRPDRISTDTASTVDTVKHCIDKLEKYDYLVLLQPTSPLRSSVHINEAIELLIEKNADAIISVCSMDHSPLWSNTLPTDGNMVHFLKDEILGKRSQDLESYYRINGAIYICKIDRFLEEETFFIKDNIFAYIMDKQHSIDIDEKIDFKLAEVLLFND